MYSVCRLRSMNDNDQSICKCLHLIRKKHRYAYARRQRLLALAEVLGLTLTTKNPMRMRNFIRQHPPEVCSAPTSATGHGHADCNPVRNWRDLASICQHRPADIHLGRGQDCGLRIPVPVAFQRPDENTKRQARDVSLSAATSI